MAFHRQAHMHLVHHAAGRSRHGNADLLRADIAARGFHPQNLAVLGAKAGDFAVLDDIDAAHVGPARIAPCHGVMPHRAAALLRQTALDREAGVVKVQEGIQCAHIFLGQQLRVGAVHDHRVAATGIGVALGVGVEQVQDAALADHRVVVEVLLQPFPQFQREFVERLVPVQQIVRADDGGVAAHVAAADPALFQQGDARLLVFLGKVIGRGQPMPATADDDVIIGRLRCGVAPCGRPALVAGKGLADHPET